MKRASRHEPPSADADFASECERISIRIVKKRHPDFMIRHFRHQVRLAIERYTARPQLLGHRANVVRLEVNGHPARSADRSLRQYQQQPTASEKRGRLPQV